MTERSTIYVYEHQWLAIGDVDKLTGKEFMQHHLDRLAEYLTQHPGCGYYQLYFDRVKFCHYVGVIKIGELTIEILPKTDRHDLEKKAWQQLLFQMLTVSLKVNIKTTSYADIALQRGGVLEAYLHLFLDEVEVLMREGLIKKYRREENNQTALKGKLLIHEHVQKNIVHAERFYVTRKVYDRDNIYNAVLYRCLNRIVLSAKDSTVVNRAKQLLMYFPECKPIVINPKLFKNFIYDRKSHRYRAAIDLARVILLNYHPDIKGGKENILAIMFDMNKLWEDYIFNMLLHAAASQNDLYCIECQSSVDYWEHPDKWVMQLQPDIVIRILDDQGNEVDAVVIDTKWKHETDVMHHDIRQLYAYGRYYHAKRRYLLYPENLLSEGIRLREGAFFDVIGNQPDKDECCGLIYADPIASDGRLNWNIGPMLLSSLV